MHEDNPAVTNVCFSPNGRFVLAFNLDNSIRLWDYVSGSVKKTYQGHKNSGFSIGGGFGVVSETDTSDGGGTRTQAFVVSASEEGDIVLWDVGTKEIVQRISGAHKGVCFWVDVHGDTMVSAGQDKMIQVYRNKSGAKSGGTEKQINGTNGTNGINGHLGDGTTPFDAPAADDELQRQIGDAASPLKAEDVKEEEP